MKITEAQFKPIEHGLARQRGNVSLTHLTVLNAIWYVAEHGCKGRGLPNGLGTWHTIYTRLNRWAKRGVLDRVFEQLQQLQRVRIRIEAGSLDSTLIKGHPDGMGALKKPAPTPSASLEAAAPLRSIGLPRMLERPCFLPYRPGKPAMRRQAGGYGARSVRRIAPCIC